MSVNRAEIYISRRNEQIALSTFRTRVIKTVAHVEITYLRLAQAVSDLHFEQRLVAQARDTRHRLQSRRHMDVDSVQISQAKAAVDLARYNAASAEKRVGDLSEAAKALLNDPAIPVGPGPDILPAGGPEPVPFAFDLNQEIAVALGRRDHAT